MVGNALFIGVFGGLGVVLGCARGVLSVGAGPCWAFLSHWGGGWVCEGCEGCVGLDHADESDDGAQAAYVVAWEEERVMNTAVFRHA